MIFKTLVLQGFKSFPDKTEIHFSSGITAIVGPNGSGKSNISDAIRWVLGEQSSRSLRGAKMEDIIFGGTKKRSALGFAEVSLILNNETGIFSLDATEIMVTRRYYRTGDSEYYLNKRHCRLRDIHELFMDTGIGRDGYSLIGQGRIDEILSVKSEDRRDVFEEAAGISKFRYRKEESTRKLAQTEENLVRIRDIYAQMEAQYQPLEKQAQKAQQYLVLRDQLRLLEITLWLQQLEQLTHDTTQAQTDCATATAQLQQAQAEQDRLYAQQEGLTTDLQTCDRQAEGLRNTLAQLEEERAQHAQEMAVLRTQITNNTDNIHRAEQSKQQRLQQAQSLDRQRESHIAQMQTLDTEYQAHLQTIARIQADHAQGAQTLATLSAQLETAQAEQQDCIAQKQAIAMAHNTAETALSGMDARHETIASDTAQAEQGLTQAVARAQQIAQQLEEAQQNLARMGNRFAGLSMKQASRQTKLDTCTQALTKASRVCADHKQRLRLLEELQRDYDGYARSVKTIMHQRDRGHMQGIHGTVTSLIAVEDTYITAIETALGAAASHIVVESTAVGKACLQHLKRTDGGRATFLPLDTIRANRLQENDLDGYVGYCGTADTLVQSAPAYRAIVQNLLARTVVMQNMDTALALAKATRNRFRIVTLDGQILQVGGAMTGGSVGKSSGVLARNAQIAQLHAQTDTLAQVEAQAQQQQTAAKRELLALTDDLHSLQTEQAQMQERVHGLQTMQAQQADLQAHLQATYDNLVRERDTVDVAKQGYLDTLSHSQAQLAEQETLLAAHAVRIEGLQAQVNTQAEHQQAAMLTLTKATADGQANRQSHVAMENALQALSKLHAEMQVGFAGDAQSMAQLTSQIATLQQELLAREQLHTQTEQTRAQLQEQLEATLRQRMQVEGARTQTQKQAQAQNQVILDAERAQAKHTQQLAQCKQQETALLDKLWETYELTPTPAKELVIAITSRREAEEKVRQLRLQIRGLGNVNLDAVEEFAQLSEKFHFLGEQKQDLETARTELEKMIAQLTKQMEQVFLTQFTLLNQHFGTTFAEMFGGGTASLVLTDPKDILGCGIDIRVAPPGKTVKTITLLSGGERAFVAIALYFAILKVRPTPFCVLDEIEAALDDVNVTRYAQYLRTLMADTQFIVITHRRGTMEEADMLYGVTMQEQGVSRMLMLNLAQAIETL